MERPVMDIDRELRAIIHWEDAIAELLEQLEREIGKKIGWVKVERDGGRLAVSIAVEKPAASSAE